MRNVIQSVCVYSASSTQVDSIFFAAARELGHLLAREGIRLINGAGRHGLMRECADACLQSGGCVTGVIPHFMVEQGWQHTGLTELIETDTMHTRKQTMARLSDGVIALPGGCGSRGRRFCIRFDTLQNSTSLHTVCPARPLCNPAPL